MIHTNATVLVQIDVQESLQTMLEGSYKSGLLKIGLRTAFAHISYLVEQYYDYVKSLKWKVTTKEPWQYLKENSPREVISPEVKGALSRYFAPL